MNNFKPITYLKPFTKFCCTIGNLPSSYLVSLTYEEQLLWLCDYIKNTLIPALNGNSDAISELQNLFTKLQEFVNEYFKNLDITDEINNKLDQMAESGELTNIISSYLSLNSIIVFPNVTSLLNATNLKNGSTVKTLGFYNINDGGGATYRISNNSIPNDFTIFSLKNNLFAELIMGNELNILTIGGKRDDKSDNYPFISFAINFLKNNSFINTLYFPIGTYRIYSNLIIDYPLNIRGDNSQDKNTTSAFVNSSASILSDFSTDLATPFITYVSTDSSKPRISGFKVKDIQIYGNNQRHYGLNLQRSGWRSSFENLRISNYLGVAIYFNETWDCEFTNCQILNSGALINGTPQFAVTMIQNTNNISFTNSQIEGCRYMFTSNGSTNINFNSCHLEYGKTPNNNDYSNYLITILNKSIININNCVLAFPNTKAYNVDEDLVQYAFYIEDSANVSCSNSNFQPADNDPRHCKYIRSNSHTQSFSSFVNCIFYKLSPRSNSLNLYGTYLSNCWLHFMDDNSNTSLKPIILENCDVNNILISYTNVNIDSGSIFTVKGNTSISNITQGNLAKFLYNTTPGFNGTIQRSNIPANYTNTSISDNLVSNPDFSNLSLDLSVNFFNSSTAYFNLSQNTTINQIKNGCNGELITLYNSSSFNVSLSNSLPYGTDGKIVSNVTIAPSKLVSLRKMASNWYIASVV